MSDEADIAWAAGLFEGEGCIQIRRRQRNYGEYRQLRITLASTDEDVIRKFHAIVGEGHVCIRGQSSEQNRKRVWAWEASTHSAERVMWRIIHHLGTRRTAKFLEVMNEVLEGRQSDAV